MLREIVALNPRNIFHERLRELFKAKLPGFNFRLRVLSATSSHSVHVTLTYDVTGGSIIRNLTLTPTPHPPLTCRVRRDVQFCCVFVLYRPLEYMPKKLEAVVNLPNVCHRILSYFDDPGRVYLNYPRRAFTQVL